MSAIEVMTTLKSQPGDNINELQAVVLALVNHLKKTNANLAKFRHSIRHVVNPKLKEKYLKKLHSMVWEQQTMRQILEDYKRKLHDLMANEEAKKQTEEKLRQGPMRNTKLFELFTNNDFVTEKIITQDEIPWTITQTDQADHTKDNKSISTPSEIIKRKIVIGQPKVVTEAEKAIPKEEITSTISQTNQVDMTKDDDVKSTPVETIKPKIVIGKPRVVTEDQNPIKKRRTSDEQKPTDEVVINCQEDALKYITALQDYALMNENFRATGLLVEVEKSLKNPPKSCDFEL